MRANSRILLTNQKQVEENLVLTVFVAMPFVVTLGLYLFFGKYGDHGSKKQHWYKLLLGNLLVLFFLGSLVILFGEAYYRFYYDTTDSFALTKTSARWLQRHVHLNNAKLRDNVDYSISILPGRRRITFIGDSFTEGQGIADVDKRFANRIRSLHPEWDIHVLAIGGLDTGRELAWLNELFKDHYEYDEVYSFIA